MEEVKELILSSKDIIEIFLMTMAIIILIGVSIAHFFAMKEWNKIYSSMFKTNKKDKR